MTGLWLPEGAREPERELDQEFAGDTWRLAIYRLRLQARVHGYLGDGQRFEVLAEFTQRDGARMQDTLWLTSHEDAWRVLRAAAHQVTKTPHDLDVRAIARDLRVAPDPAAT